LANVAKSKTALSSSDASAASAVPVRTGAVASGLPSASRSAPYPRRADARIIAGSGEYIQVGAKDEISFSEERHRMAADDVDD
jgi:hypothetical protein